MIKKTRALEDALKLSHIEREELTVPVPEYLLITTDNARCPKAEVFIHEGDYVKLGQPIGVRHGGFFDQPIHATCSGTFEGYEKHYHRSGKIVSFMKIHNDFKDAIYEGIKPRSQEEIDALTRDQVVEILKNCASVGLGGSSFPTYVKFQTKTKINTVLIDGVECEPYINADHRALMEEPDHILDGMKLVKHIFGVNDVRLCFKKKYKDIEATYDKLFAKEPHEGISYFEVPNVYPMGWENRLVEQATKIHVEPGKRPADYGVMVINASTLLGIRLALRENMPVYQRRVTVTGDGIVKPADFFVRVGTPVKYLIEKCGGYKDPDKPKTFILGGPMMGASLPSDDCILTKTVTSIIVINKRNYLEEPCIRCGSCVASCPVGLLPVDIMNAMKHMPVDKAKVKMLNPLKCIECGLCAYSCTSNINVTDYVRRAKVIARLK